MGNSVLVSIRFRRQIAISVEPYSDSDQIKAIIYKTVVSQSRNFAVNTVFRVTRNAYN
jgi:hypothetical protein